MKKLKELKWMNDELFANDVKIGSIVGLSNVEEIYSAYTLMNRKSFNKYSEAKAWVESQVRAEIESLFEEEV